MTEIPTSTPSFITPPADIAALSPPNSPQLSAKRKKCKGNIGSRCDEPAVDLSPAEIPDNYVAWTLRNTRERPPITWPKFLGELNYISLAALTITPTIAIWGIFYVQLRWKTAVFAVLYYFITGLGITAGASEFNFWSGVDD